MYEEKIAVIGGGNWGSAIAKKIGQNFLAKYRKEKEEEGKANHHKPEGLVMWLYEEYINNEKLTDIINTRHENIKYLPQIPLPDNVRASSDLIECVKDKKILLFVIPHQFLRGTIKNLQGVVSPDTICVSLMKGIEASTNGDHQIKRFTTIIEEELGVHNAVAIMGANVATDVAHDHFAEATIASLNRYSAIAVAELLECDSFRTEITYDVSSVEWCGALKNIYALGAGMCDGMGGGSNAKAALLRQALKEMTEFCRVFDQTGHFKVETLLRSCGVADLIATSYGGRNRKCAAEFYTRCQQRNDLDEEKTKLLWEEIESELLNGQKLQGVSTCYEVVDFLHATRHWEKHPDHFPLLHIIFKIITTGQSFESLFHYHHAVHFTHR